MKINTLLNFIFALFLFPSLIFSQANEAGYFVENKGQVLDFNENFHPEVKYYYSDANAAVYFQNDRLVYNFKQSETLDLALFEGDRNGLEEAQRTQKIGRAHV